MVHFLKNIDDYSRADDGVDYVAIHGRARTPLGRALASTAALTIQMKDFGEFKSIGGLVAFLNGDRRGGMHDCHDDDLDIAMLSPVDSRYHDLLVKAYSGALRDVMLPGNNTLAETLNDLKIPLVHIAKDPLGDGFISFPYQGWYRDAVQSVYKRYISLQHAIAEHSPKAS